MSKFLFFFAVLAAAFALLLRYYHHVAAFHRLEALSVICAVLAVVAFRRHPIAHFLDDFRHYVD